MNKSHVLKKIIFGYILFAMRLRILLMYGFAPFGIVSRMTTGELVFLYSMAHGVGKKPVIVGAGSNPAKSTIFLANAAKELEGVVYVAEDHDNEKVPAGTKNTHGELTKNIEKLKGYIKPLKDFNIAHGPNAEIDFFSPGVTAHRGVLSDIETWMPKLKNGGVAIFYGMVSVPGVKEAVNSYTKTLRVKEIANSPNIYCVRIWKS